jgi:hypothetical protein
MVADAPLQMVLDPLTTAVGRAFTVRIALPVKSLARAVHLASLNAVTV